MARFIWLSLCHPNIQPVIGLTEAKPHKLVFPWSDRGNILDAITQLRKIKSHSPLLSIDTWVRNGTIDVLLSIRTDILSIAQTNCFWDLLPTLTGHHPREHKERKYT